MTQIDAVLNDFLKQQGLHDELNAYYDPTCDSYYQYGSDMSRVVLGGMTNKVADEIYMRFCKDLGLKVDIDVITMSFLHEVGHHMTLDFLDEDEISESEWTKVILRITKDDSEYTEEDYMKYFNCPEEFEATWDAIKFCNACPEVAKALDTAILETIYDRS